MEERQRRKSAMPSNGQFIGLQNAKSEKTSPGTLRHSSTDVLATMKKNKSQVLASGGTNIGSPMSDD